MGSERAVATTDVLVVGSGPAGSTLARTLAAAGRDVLLIEAKAHPRHKACAGGLPPRTLQILDPDVTSVLDGRMASVVLKGGRKRIEISLRRQLTEAFRRGTPLARSKPTDQGEITGWTVDRAEFDAFLTRQAVDQGAKLIERCRFRTARKAGQGYTVQTSKGVIEAQRICACDGTVSRTARVFGFPPNPCGLCLEALVPMPADLTPEERTRAILDLTAMENGYIWSFPRRDLFAVGIGSMDGKASVQILKEKLNRFVHRTEEFRGGRAERVRGGLIPWFTGPRERYAREGVYLVGDAAGVVDPLTGEGIYQAILSAQLAAQALQGDGEREYEHLLKEQLMPELLECRRYVRKLLWCPRWALSTVLSLGVVRRKCESMIRVRYGDPIGGD